MRALPLRWRMLGGSARAGPRRACFGASFWGGAGGGGGRKKKRRFLFFFFFTAKKNKTLLRAKPQLKASILLNFLGGIGDEGLLLALVQCNAIGS